MDRQTRNLLHKKQERVKVDTGHPSKDSIVEGKFEFRFISGSLYLVTKYGSKLYYNKFSETT